MNRFKNEKDRQLGIPFGTACHRLKLQILFKYIKKAKENFCFDCKKEILTPEELSIQHKKVWLYISPELFWDLENIAFSHRKCNKRERNFRQKYFTEEERHEADKRDWRKSWHKNGKHRRKERKLKHSSVA